MGKRQEIGDERTDQTSVRWLIGQACWSRQAEVSLDE
jgi:hypothetical protein